MVRKYRLKIGGMPHSRRERDFYLKAFRHHLLAQPPAEIAKHLNAPGPTVRRALHRLRLAMVSSTEFGDYMRAMAESVQSKYAMLYEDIFVGTWNAYTGSIRISLKEVDQCLRACRITLKPNEFRRKYLKYYRIPLGEFVFIVPTVDDQQQLSAYLDDALKCRYCVMQHMKNSYRAVFAALPHVYLDYMHYFSTRRIVDPTYNQLMQLHLDATTVSMANELYLNVFTGAVQAHGHTDEAKEEFLEYFFQTTEQMFGIIERLDLKEMPLK